MKIKQLKRRLARGFTLIELVVVVAVIGILAAMFMPKMLGGKDGAKAELLLKASSDVAQNWMMISQRCGTTTSIANSPLPASGKTVADVIFGGVSNVAAAYQTCYNQAKVIAMSEIAQQNGTVWQVQGYAVSFSGGGTTPMVTTYAGVPDELTLLMAQHYAPALATLAASDTTSTVVRYGTASSGTRSVTILRPVG